MKRLVTFSLIISLMFSQSILKADILFFDEFYGDTVSSSGWHIPTWKSSDDGTYIGRTQFRCTQHSSLPKIKDGNAIITVETYNSTGFSFYGTDVISNDSFSLGNGIKISVRAKMNTTRRGIVGGIFLYALKPGSENLHDEIDFEFLTNRPNGVLTNTYANDPHDAGHPHFVQYRTGSITDYHTYEIRWQRNRVSWFIDDKIVRTDTSHVPAGPMNFHLNMWVPDTDWPEAYDSSLQPTRSQSSNQIFWMDIDSIKIQSITRKQS